MNTELLIDKYLKENLFYINEKNILKNIDINFIKQLTSKFASFKNYQQLNTFITQNGSAIKNTIEGKIKSIDPFGNTIITKQKKQKPAKKPTDPQVTIFLTDLYKQFKDGFKGINLENIKQAFLMIYKILVKFLLVGTTIIFMNMIGFMLAIKLTMIFLLVIIVHAVTISKEMENRKITFFEAVKNILVRIKKIFTTLDSTKYETKYAFMTAFLMAMYYLIYKSFFLSSTMVLVIHNLVSTTGAIIGIASGSGIGTAIGAASPYIITYGTMAILVLFIFYFFIDMLDDFNMSKLKERSKEALV